MVRRFVWSRKLVNGEALAHWGLSCKKKKLTPPTVHGYVARYAKGLTIP